MDSLRIRRLSAMDPARGSATSELAAFVRSYKGAFIGVGLMSAVVNVLTLTGTVYMLEVYDRVLPSKSVPTLVGLSIIVIGLFALQGGLEFIRSRVLSNVGAGLDEIFGNRVYNAILRLPLVTKTNGDGLQPLRDLDQVRSFMGSAGPTALFDLPWMPLYLIISFMFHFWIGMTALIGCTVLVALTLTAERMTKEPARNSTTLLAARNAMTESTRRNAEVIRAMGMGNRLGARWSSTHLDHLDANLRASDIAGSLGTSVPHVADDVAVTRAGRWRISCDPSGGERRRDHCLLGAAVSCSSAGRTVDRALEAVPIGSPELGPAHAAFAPIARRAGAHAASGSRYQSEGREHQCRGARRTQGHHSGCDLCNQCWAGFGDHRSERVREINACSRIDRGLACRARIDPPGWSCDRPMVVRATRQPCRLSSSGY